TSQTSSPGARVTGQNGRGSAKQAVPRTAPPARTLSAYLHRRGDRKWFRDGSVYRFGACFTVLPCPDRCPVPATGRPGQGARSARAAAPQAPLRRPPGSGSWLAGARERPAGSAVSVGLAWAFLAGDGGDLLHSGTGGRRGA